MTEKKKRSRHGHSADKWVVAFLAKRGAVLSADMRAAAPEHMRKSLSARLTELYRAGRVTRVMVGRVLGNPQYRYQLAEQSPVAVGPKLLDGAAILEEFRAAARRAYGIEQ